MAHVLRVTAAQVGDPITGVILMEARDLSVHGSAVRDRGARRKPGLFSDGCGDAHVGALV